MSLPTITNTTTTTSSSLTTTTTATTPTTTKGNGSSQACAACKYQRRKCAPDCILAPYFPHDSQRQFLNAHKLFGVSNITKIIKNLDPRAKDEAMRSIIIQSDARANDPVGGCYRIIRDLQLQIQYAQAELSLVQQHLAICRAQHAASSDIVNGVDHLSMYGNMQDGLQGQFLQPVQGQEQYFLQNDNHDNHHQQQHLHNNSHDDVSSWVVQDSAASSSVCTEYFKQDVDVKPFLADDRNEPTFEIHLQRGTEAVLRPVDDSNAILLKEEDRYSMQQQDDSKDADILFRHTDCSS